MGNNDLSQKIIQWGRDILVSLGYTLNNSHPENVVDSPWSYLIRFETSAGYFYLKHTPKLFALEPMIIQILHDQFHASVPTIVAHSLELDCFLMKDAGRTLREILKHNFDEALLCRTIDQFTSLQIAISDHVDVLLNIGVADYRLDKLPVLYKNLISQKDLLIAEDLSDIEMNKLKLLHPVITSYCKKLSDYPIKQTLVQPDFNDNNTLVDETSQNITMIDLGEIVISHPFFSLFNCLKVIKKHHGLTQQDHTYSRIKDECFKNYISFFNSKDHLLDAIEIAQLVENVYRLSYQFTFMMACGKKNLVSYQHWKLGDLLRAFIDTFEKNILP